MVSVDSLHLPCLRFSVFVWPFSAIWFDLNRCRTVCMWTAFCPLSSLHSAHKTASLAVRSSEGVDPESIHLLMVAEEAVHNWMQWETWNYVWIKLYNFDLFLNRMRTSGSTKSIATSDTVELNKMRIIRMQQTTTRSLEQHIIISDFRNNNDGRKTNPKHYFPSTPINK